MAQQNHGTERVGGYFTQVLKIEIEQEVDGRWIADVSDLPGVMAYGQTRADAIAKAKALALRVLADRLDDGDQIGPRMLSRIAKKTGLTPEDL